MGRVTPRQCSTVRAAPSEPLSMPSARRVVLVAGEGSAMDRELRNRKRLAVVG